MRVVGWCVSRLAMLRLLERVVDWCVSRLVMPPLVSEDGGLVCESVGNASAC